MNLKALAAASARLAEATATALEAKRAGTPIVDLAPYVAEVRLAVADLGEAPSNMDPAALKEHVRRAQNARWLEVQRLAKAAWKGCDPIVLESLKPKAQPRPSHVAQVVQHVADLQVALLMAEAAEAAPTEP